MSRTRLAFWLIALTTLLMFLPATRNNFINYDDDIYVTHNSVVQNGFTADGIKWAFTGWHASNWHPLTWLSHMADFEMFRFYPGGHHLINILFHAANAALLFALLMRLTAAFWPNVFIAALFAIHPLHVESVAWVSERKDVLSTFFAFLTLLFYAKFAKEKQRADFWLTFLFFVFGLLCKPMLVTLPFVILLLDFWPLQRLNASTLRQLLVEKIPFFILSIASCAVTFLAQKNSAVASLTKVSLPLRFENAVVTYVGYLEKMVWPAHLCIFYPLPEKISAMAIVVSVAILISISAAVWILRNQKPYLLVGWLWYLGTLVPVIGIVQVGDQAMADRYTYFPLIGIFFALAFLANDFVRRFTFLKMPLTLAAILISCAFIFLTENQLRYWHDSETLFRHALKVAPDNALARLNLGSALEEKNDFAGALEQFQRALQLDPTRNEVYNNVAKLLAVQGKFADALPYCREAVRLDPNSAISHYGLGVVLKSLGNFNEATNEFTEAIKLNPDYAAARFQLDQILSQLKKD